ncbi:GSCFA domain-containing protein [Nocardioides nanhaiensis]|uniref:GSCFA domain-containing protein n=1 Tax=Nocardioides nanhaiensis TaxID=1476871 RepID=A0ABP8VNG6_9ACTN
MADHPYRDLPPEALWRRAVAERSPLHLEHLYRPRFPLGRETRIAAAGSCFAQHIGRQFKERGYAFLDAEPAPPLLEAGERGRFGYDMYSARYGNLYSARQLLQLVQRAQGTFTPLDEAWEEGGRWFDPFRPTIEPDGFASLEELRAVREHHLGAVRSLLEQADVFVFTFGLTEAWIDTRDGAVLPLCPGTAHGTFDPEQHAFHNFSWPEVMGDFEEFMRLAREVNPTMRFLVTVSPVPLTATASGQHVLTASVASKSILRAVCAELVARHEHVDYFPSYELVTSHPMRAMFFDPNLRTVAPRGVAHVMSTFFEAHEGTATAAPTPASTGRPAQVPVPHEDDVVCDEAILDTFGA